MVSLALDTPELAKLYDFRGQRQYTHGRLLIADLGILQGHHVLDIGTGTGLLAAYVADVVGPTGRVVGIDPLAFRIAIANQRARGNLSFHVGEAGDLSKFGDESFDVVYLNSVFHWLRHKHAVLTEIRRVLKPGGRLGLTTASLEQPHSIEAARQRALAAAGLANRAEAVRSIHHRVSAAELEALFGDTAFRKLQVEIRTFVDYDSNVDEILDFGRASSFGNDLASLTDGERQRFRAALQVELEKVREARGIRQERHLIFAVAEKARA